MNICYVVENEEELLFAERIKKNINDKFNIYVLINIKGHKDEVDSNVISFLSKINIDFDIYQVSIFSTIYNAIKLIAHKRKKQLLVCCNDFAATMTLSQQFKKISTIHSYAYYQARLTFVDNIIVNSIVGKRRINDMGIYKNIFILPPSYEDFKENANVKKNDERSENSLIFDTSAFESEDIIEFVSHLDEIEKNFDIQIIIDASTSDFLTLYSINSNIVYSTKDFNRLTLYRNAKYIYSYSGKIDDFDYLLAIKSNLIIIDSLGALCNGKNESIDHINNEKVNYVRNKFSFRNNLKKLEDIYEHIRRIYY